MSSLSSPPSNGTATGKKGSIRKGSGKSFSTEAAGTKRNKPPTAPSQAQSDNPY